jgi:hypothetical protein
MRRRSLRLHGSSLPTEVCPALSLGYFGRVPEQVRRVACASSPSSPSRSSMRWPRVEAGRFTFTCGATRYGSWQQAIALRAANSAISRSLGSRELTRKIRPLVRRDRPVHVATAAISLYLGTRIEQFFELVRRVSRERAVVPASRTFREEWRLTTHRCSPAWSANCATH